MIVCGEVDIIRSMEKYVKKERSVVKKALYVLTALMVILLLSSCQRPNDPDDNSSFADHSSSVGGTSSHENLGSSDTKLSDEELANIVATQLNIPENAEVTYKISDVYYDEEGCYYHKSSG